MHTERFALPVFPHKHNLACQSGLKTLEHSANESDKLTCLPLKGPSCLVCCRQSLTCTTPIHLAVLGRRVEVREFGTLDRPLQEFFESE